MAELVQIRELPQGRELVLTLPLPPSINHQYATVNGRRVLSRAGREFKALVAEAVADWLEQQPLAEEVAVLLRRHYLALSIIFYFTSALRRDLDGGLKIAQDALCEALDINDNLVVEIHLSKRVDRQAPRIEVLLAALSTTCIDLHEETNGSKGQGEDRPLALLVRPGGKTRRRRRKPRSLEELAARYRWE
jgi:crossover junction endodeoxyribonuclease RusA